MTRDLSFAATRRRLPRVAGGIAALSYPTLLVVLAIRTGFGAEGDLTGLAAAFLSALLVVIAAPTAWLFAFDFVEAGRFTIVFVGALTSFPLWYLVGSALAARSERWSSWILRYGAVAIGWTTLNLVVVSTLAAIVG